MIELLGASLYWQYYIMGIILLPGLILAMIAQTKVTRTYNLYSGVQNQGGRTAGEVARLLLDTAGLNDVKIIDAGSELGDYYNHKEKTIALGSRNSASVSAIGIAAHEVGHALQYKAHYIPIKIRTLAIHMSNAASTLMWPLVIIGLVFNFGMATNSIVGNVCLWAGIAVFGLATLVNLVTLPVEYNASRRATNILKDSGILTVEETDNAKEVLSAAALTYVAALVISILSLIRFLAVFLGNRDR